MAVVVLGAGYWTAHASAFVYWGSVTVGPGVSPGIGRANLDGSGVNNKFIPVPGSPSGEAVNGSYIYWSNFNGAKGSIGRANLDGSNPEQSFIPNAIGPEGVAVAGNYIYWADFGNGSIGRANIDGSGVNQNFITGITGPGGIGGPNGIAIYGGHIYWANSESYEHGEIGRANLDGGDVIQDYITGANEPAGVAVNSQYIYWGDYGNDTIGRANIDGTDVDQDFISAGPLYSLSIDGQYLYWADGQIGRANLNGSDVINNYIKDPAESAGMTSVLVTGVLVPWRLHLKAAPLSATIGTPLTIAARTDNALVGTPDYLNIFLNSKLVKSCAVNNGDSCGYSFNPAPNATYKLSADVGVRHAKPFRTGSIVSRRRKVTVIRTRVTCHPPACT